MWFVRCHFCTFSRLRHWQTINFLQFLLPIFMELFSNGMTVLCYFAIFDQQTADIANALCLNHFFSRRLVGILWKKNIISINQQEFLLGLIVHFKDIFIILRTFSSWISSSFRTKMFRLLHCSDRNIVFLTFMKIALRLSYGFWQEKYFIELNINEFFTQQGNFSMENIS